jgi:ferredoxin-NADP reductase
MNIAELVNKMSNIFSMYKGISFGLLGIWTVAFALSFFDLISFSPLAMVISLIVVVLSVYGASYVCGRFFGVHVHGESSLITGLILALIISPSLDIGGIVVLVFAGIIAGVSKFIVVHNGRHIFNPAALAAFVIGIAGLGGASWWVATPVLTPIVLMVALISLYKSHRLPVAGVFLAVSIPILLIVFSMYNTTFLDNIYLLLSWPLLFIAGVMLTEPLTLPPRKWQMYVEAAIVGVLVAIPLNLIVIEMTPALAILVGNIVAAIFLARENIQLVLKRRRKLTPTTEEYVFTPNKPLHYTAGQYVEIQLPHKKTDFRGYRRSFSFTSAPGKQEVSLGIKFYEPSSSFKSALKALPVGSTISATGYWGDFVLPKDPATPLTYIAGGIGITPFISHLQASVNYKDVRNTVLVYAVNNAEEIAYKDLLVKSGIKVIIVTKDKITDLPQNWKQVKAGRINEEILAKAIPDVANRQAYISGPTPFIDTARRALRSLGAKHIKTDYFTGY